VLGTRGSLQHDRDRMKDAVAFIAQIENVAERNLFIKRISERIGVDEGVLNKEVSTTVLGSRVPEDRVRSGHPKMAVHFDPVELSLILMILSHPEMIEQLEKTKALAYFATDSLKSLGEAIKNRYLTEGAIDLASIMAQLTDLDLKRKLLGHLVDEGAREATILNREFSDTVIKIKKKWYKERRRILNLQLHQAQERNDRGLCDELLQATTQLLNEEKASLK
jgi:DNA primase